MWPDLAKFGEIFLSFSIFKGLLSIWQIANLHWQSLCAIGQKFIVAKGQILKELTSHLVTLDLCPHPSPLPKMFCRNDPRIVNRRFGEVGPRKEFQKTITSVFILFAFFGSNGFGWINRNATYLPKALHICGPYFNKSHSLHQTLPGVKIFSLFESSHSAKRAGNIFAVNSSLCLLAESKKI